MLVWLVDVQVPWFIKILVAKLIQCLRDVLSGGEISYYWLLNRKKISNSSKFKKEIDKLHIFILIHIVLTVCTLAIHSIDSNCFKSGSELSVSTSSRSRYESATTFPLLSTSDGTVCKRLKQKCEAQGLLIMQNRYSVTDFMVQSTAPWNQLQSIQALIRKWRKSAQEITCPER